MAGHEGARRGLSQLPGPSDNGPVLWSKAETEADMKCPNGGHVHGRAQDDGFGPLRVFPGLFLAVESAVYRHERTDSTITKPKREERSSEKSWRVDSFP